MASPPLIDSRLAPGPLIVVVALSVSFSSPAVRVIVWGVLNRLEKVIVSAVGRALARLIAWRRLSSPGLDPTPSAVVLTMILGWVWKCADVDTTGARLAALVGRGGVRRCATADRRAARERGHGEGRPAVVAQHRQERVAGD